MTVSDQFKNGIRFNFKPQFMDEVWWNNNFTTVGQPYDLCDFLTNGLPGVRDYIIDKISHPENSTSMEALGCTNQGTKIFWTGRTISFGLRELNLDLSSIEPPYQGRGYGTSLAGNCYRLAVDLNLHRLTVTALGSGSYVWARAGFTPFQYYWDRLRAQVTAFLPKISGMSNKDAQSVDMLLKSADPTSIWALSDFEADVNVQTKASALRCSLGKALLFHSDTSWRGTIELLAHNQDAEQIKRASDYFHL